MAHCDRRVRPEKPREAQAFRVRYAERGHERLLPRRVEPRRVLGEGRARREPPRVGVVGRLARRHVVERRVAALVAAEELVAELASAMIGAELGLPVDHLDDHASYLGSWLKVLKTDARAILTAAAKAEEASAYLLKLGRAERPAELSLAA